MEYYERGGVSYDDTSDDVLNTILCFDLVDRKFSMIVPPVDDEKTFREWNIGSRKVITYPKSLVSPARDARDDHESPIYRPDLSDVDIATQVSEAILESQ
ncbi:hypothetical protein Q3G72_001541 [Acer saccharum]|nr:hypothetical protein Q3G72_001541 [Acer saccharum]